MTAICIAVKRRMTINVAIVAIVVNAVLTVVMSAIVITLTLKSVTTVVVVGRIVDTVIIDIIITISITSIIIIMTAISMTVTSVRASVVNRKKKLGRRAAIRTTAPSRGATSPVDFSRRANVGSEPVAPAQTAARDGDLARFLCELYTVLQRCAGVALEGGCPQWTHERVERFAIIRRCHLKIGLCMNFVRPRPSPATTKSSHLLAPNCGWH